MGTPELRPTPDFRPESAGEQEYRVDVLIERHVLPPITRDEAREHPVLAGLEVLQPPVGRHQPLHDTRTVVGHPRTRAPGTRSADGGALGAAGALGRAVR